MLEAAASEWTLAGPATAPVYDPLDEQSARALVTFHLRELGLGELNVIRVGEDGLRYIRDVRPRGLGVCRAYVLTEAAWPEGAELCVTVDWSPDAPYVRDFRKGSLPPGAEGYWQERIDATVRALETVGFVAEPNRFSSPFHHPTAELLVYRMPDGVLPRRLPPDGAWVLTEPVPPNYRSGYWTWADRSPEDVVKDALRGSEWEECLRHEDTPLGRVGVRGITQAVWPPEADRCAWVTWWPAPDFAPGSESGLPSTGAVEHWGECLARLRATLTSAGLMVRPRARPRRPQDETADFLVYRVAS
ncbi:hypothetical protein ACFWR6_06540 [Streptomyces griseus]|uniref:hypothetical protein n=1 Tax=Streptomyces griseus TaxID=1911 RepID=UPI003661FDBC